MKIKFEALLDKVMEYYDADRDYAAGVAAYRKKHGFAPYMDIYNGLDKERADIHYDYQERGAALDVVWALFDLLDLDADQRGRAWTAARALRRWYQKTEWKFCARADLLARLEKFVIG